MNNLIQHYFEIILLIYAGVLLFMCCPVVFEMCGHYVYSSEKSSH
jgi:hypothetical protein